MNILVTGAKGMVGQALCANLKNIRDGKNLLQAVDTAAEMNKMVWRKL